MGMNPSSEPEIMGYQDGQAALHNTKAPQTLWRNVTFRRILYGYGISVFGDCFNGIAISLWVLRDHRECKEHGSRTDLQYGRQFSVWIGGGYGCRPIGSQEADAGLGCISRRNGCADCD